MASMKTSLPGLVANLKSALPKRTRGYYGVALDELQRHLEELAGGQHTVAAFAEHYCITPRAKAAATEGAADGR